jgi:hypothetical protein
VVLQFVNFGADTCGCGSGLVLQLKSVDPAFEFCRNVDMKQAEGRVHGALQSNGAVRKPQVEFPRKGVLKVSLRMKERPTCR